MKERGTIGDRIAQKLWDEITSADGLMPWPEDERGDEYERCRPLNLMTWAKIINDEIDEAMDLRGLSNYDLD